MLNIGMVLNFWFSHIAEKVPGVETSNEWLEPVTDEEYNKLDQKKFKNLQTNYLCSLLFCIKFKII